MDWKKTLTIVGVIVGVVIVTIIVTIMAKSYLLEQAPYTMAALDERKDYEDLAYSLKIRPWAREAFKGYAEVLQEVERSVGWEITARLVKMSKDYRAGGVSRDELYKTVNDSAEALRKLEKFLRSSATNVHQKEPTAPAKSWLDEILDSNPRKFLFVIAILLVILLITAAITGKAALKSAGWSIAAVLIVFVALNWLLESGWSQITQSASSATAQQAQTTSRKKVLQTQPDRWSAEVVLPGGVNFHYDCSAGNWIEMKSPNGEIVRATGTEWLKVDKQGNILGTMTTKVLPSSRFRLRSQVPATVEITY